MDKKLPAGEWVFLWNAPPDVSLEHLSEFFGSCGLRISPDHISARSSRAGTSAVVCISRDVVVDLLNWAVQDKQLDGRDLSFELLKRTNGNGKA